MGGCWGGFTGSRAKIDGYDSPRVKGLVLCSLAAVLASSLHPSSSPNSSPLLSFRALPYTRRRWLTSMNVKQISFSYRSLSAYLSVYHRLSLSPASPSHPFLHLHTPHSHSITQANENTGEIVVQDPEQQSGTTGNVPKSFSFDAVFGENSTQRQVYDTCAAPVVESVLNGFNGTIFAYGQTGTGTDSFII